MLKPAVFKECILLQEKLESMEIKTLEFKPPRD